jgi:hypothetical protein
VKDPVDVVVNLVAGSREDTEALLDVTKPGGVLVSATSPGGEFPERDATVIFFSGRSDPVQLAHIVDRVEAGHVRLDISDRCPLADARLVHEQSEAGAIRGRQFGGVFGASILVMVLGKAKVTGDPSRFYELCCGGSPSPCVRARHPAARWERYAKRQSRSGADRGSGVPRQQERSEGMNRNGPGGSGAVCATALVAGRLTTVS